MWSTRDSTGSWDPVGAGSPLLLALPGVGSTTGVAAGGSLIFLALWSADSIFLGGVAFMDLSRVTNDEPSCSASEEEGELGFFCSSEEEGELGFSVGVR